MHRALCVLARMHACGLIAVCPSCIELCRSGCVTSSLCISRALNCADLVVCLDSGCGNYEQLWVTTSLRGIVMGTLEVSITREGGHQLIICGLSSVCRSQMLCFSVACTLLAYHRPSVLMLPMCQFRTSSVSVFHILLRSCGFTISRPTGPRFIVNALICIEHRLLYFTSSSFS